jgi:hypothetical protein
VIFFDRALETVVVIYFLKTAMNVGNKHGHLPGARRPPASFSSCRWTSPSPKYSPTTRHSVILNGLNRFKR